MSHQICLKWNNHMTMINDFKNYLLTQTMVDVTLACDGKSLKAHKLVLSACSPFFQTLFKENPCKHPIVILQGMKYSELKAVIDFIYDGEVNVTEDRLEDLIKTAETLRVKVLGDVMIASDESENQFVEGTEIQADDGLQKQSNEETAMQINEGTEKQFNEGTEKQFNEGMEKQLNEEMEKQFDEGMEKKSNEGEGKQPDNRSGNKSSNVSENQSTDILESQRADQNQPIEGLSHQQVSSNDKPSIKKKRGRPRKLVKFQNSDGTSKARNEQVDDVDIEELHTEVEFHTVNSSVSTVPSPFHSKNSSHISQQKESENNNESFVVEENFENATLNNLIAEQTLTINDSPKQESLQSSLQSKEKGPERSSPDRSFKLLPIPSLPDSFVVLRDVMTLIHTSQPSKTSSGSLSSDVRWDKDISKPQTQSGLDNNSPSNTVYEFTDDWDDSESAPSPRKNNWSPNTSYKVSCKFNDSQSSKTSYKRLQIDTSKRWKEIPRIASQPVKLLKYKAKDSEEDSSSRKVLKEKIENTGSSIRWIRFYRCKKCSFKTRYSESLKRHVIAKHEKTKKFKCELCTYAASLRQHLKRHTAEVHYNVVRFECSLCPYKCAQQANVKRHFEIVHEGKKPFQCEQCGFRSAQKSHIKKHVMAIHEQRRDFTCDFCTYRCSNKQNLKRHLQLLHKITRNIRIT